jgi:ABC-2 type transport system ATP-binding protein
MRNSTEEIAISVSNVSKSFKLPHEKQSSIKGLFVNAFRGKRTYERQQVLKDMSFDIKKGEFFGIVGRNGGGKSTLLKLLAGIYTPDKGHIQINGKLIPFIELGVGFNQELTGRENVFLNGALLGFNREEMQEMYDEIVKFAELEKFMDQKLKNYSSGMQVRLAFSIAIRAQGDILVLDEVLAVGDEAFQRKCYEYFAQLKIANKTVILVTHGMENVIRFCDRGMLISGGKVEYIGSANKVAKLYSEKNIELGGVVDNEISKSKQSDDRYSVHVTAIDIDGKDVKSFIDQDKVRLRVKLSTSTNLEDVFIGLSIHKSNGEAVFVGTTEENNNMPTSLTPGNPIEIQYEVQNIFSEDIYRVNMSIKSKNRTKTYLIAEDLCRFQIVVTSLHRMSLRPEFVIKVNTPK